jgi:hypothetical protein
MARAQTWVYGGCGEDGTDRAGPPRSERERARRRTVHDTDETGPQRRQREREQARARGNRQRQSGPTGQWKGDRARARTRAIADRWDPPAKRRGHTRGLARLGWASWAEFRFSFSPEFLKAFLFIFSMDFKSNSNPNQIQTISHMCIKQKNNLGSV